MFPVGFSAVIPRSLPVSIPSNFPSKMLLFSPSFILSVVLSLLFSNPVYADSHVVVSSLRTRHFGRAPTTLPLSERNVTGRDVSLLEKRFDGARFSFYQAGLGACGKTNSGSDFIVALNTPQYAGGSHCFDTITITAEGKTTQAQIVDECPGCPFGGLDFSTGLFSFFASESEGIITGSWTFGGGGSPPPQAPSTTSNTPPQTTSTPPPSTTQQLKTVSSTTTSSSSASLSASSSSVASTSTSIAASAAPTETATPTDVLSQFNLAFMGLVGIIASGAQVT